MNPFHYSKPADVHEAVHLASGASRFIAGGTNLLGGTLQLGNSLAPQLGQSVLSLVQEQSQRLQAMQAELETVRSALTERKTLERAKGLLMAHRQLSESEAHKLLRQTAMNQNRRLIDVAEAVLAMADLLPPAQG